MCLVEATVCALYVALYVQFKANVFYFTSEVNQELVVIPGL